MEPQYIGVDLHKASFQACAVSATGPTWALVDAIQALGASVCVVDTRKTKLKAGFAAKCAGSPMHCGGSAW
jgi:hypothetical protein